MDVFNVIVSDHNSVDVCPHHDDFRNGQSDDVISHMHVANNEAVTARGG